MNTNNKEFKYQVRQHILDILDEEQSQEPQTQLQLVADEFNHYHTGQRRLTASIQESFIDWCRGLPSHLNVEFRHYEINKIMTVWFRSIGKEYDENKLPKMMNEDPMQYYLSFILREIKALFKQYDVDGGVL